MKTRWLVGRVACVVVALLALGMLAGAAVAQECTWTGVERIVAVGDVHGDFDQMVKTLRAANVIDEKNEWCAGKTHLVQTGDVMDRGPDSRKAMDLLMRLEEQAGKAGGMVHALIGNHEAMVLLGDWRYLTKEEIESFGGEEEFKKAMGPDGKYGKWIRGHDTAIKINDTLFVHGGLGEKYAATGLDKINEAVRAQLTKGDEKGIAMEEDGPQWNRRLAIMNTLELPDELKPVLDGQKVARVVIGHTVTLKGIRARAEGKIIMIDVGMCKHYGGRAGCLIVEKGELFEVYAGEKPKKLAMKGDEEKGE